MSDESETLELKAGDYMIHVLLEKVKNIKPEKGLAQINAMLKMDACGITNFSATKKGFACRPDQMKTWNEHLFFEKKGISSEDIQEA